MLWLTVIQADDEKAAAKPVPMRDLVLSCVMWLMFLISANAASYIGVLTVAGINGCVGSDIC